MFVWINLTIIEKVLLSCSMMIWWTRLKRICFKKDLQVKIWHRIRRGYLAYQECFQNKGKNHSMWLILYNQLRVKLAFYSIKNTICSTMISRMILKLILMKIKTIKHVPSSENLKVNWESCFRKDYLIWSCQQRLKLILILQNLHLKKTKAWRLLHFSIRILIYSIRLKVPQYL